MDSSPQNNPMGLGFRKAQLEDETTGRLVRAKENGEARPEWGTLPHLPASTKMYWLQWDHLEIHEGVICTRYESRWWEISEMANSFAREILNPQAPGSPALLVGPESTGIILNDSDNVSEMPAFPPAADGAAAEPQQTNGADIPLISSNLENFFKKAKEKFGEKMICDAVASFLLQHADGYGNKCLQKFTVGL